MSTKIAVLLILSFIGSAYLGIFLGSMDHQNKISVSPSISQPIQQNHNPSEKTSPSFQYSSSTQAPSSPHNTSPSFQYGNGTH